MRTAHWKAFLLSLLLLSLHSVSVCLAAICGFDEYVEKVDLQHIATAKNQPKGPKWEPIRIVTSAKDIQGPPKYCEKNDGAIHELGKKDAAYGCTAIFATINSEKIMAVMGILERAIKLHTDRLLVRRGVGSLLIPDFSKHKRCKLFNIPEEHHTTGVANADMVLYVASARDTGDYGAALLGETCAKCAGGRPIAGGLIFGSGNIEINRLTVRITAHHIAHALGFSYSEMNSHTMIMDKKVRGKPNPVAVVNSEKTKKMTQEHFGCFTAEGMELEDGEKNNEKLSHWERRNAKDELMAKPPRGPGTSFIGFYTNITLATFEEMGFYKANFQMAEHMAYGYKTGCGFLNGKCMKNGVTHWPNMFCADSESDEEKKFCTTDRLELGKCALKDDYRSSLPEYFQYFTSPNKGGAGSSLTDHCPVAEQDPFLGCANSKGQEEIPGSLLGKNSMCLDGSELKAKRNSGTVPVGAVCAEILCEGGSVKVKYLGDTNGWHKCPEGKTLTPSLTSNSFESGTIKCPKYKEVCTVALDGSSLVPKVVVESMEPPTKTPPPASQDPTASQDPKASQDPTASQDPKASDKPTGQPNNSNSGGKSKDVSSVPFGLLPSVTFIVLSFAGYLIA